MTDREVLASQYAVLRPGANDRYTEEAKLLEDAKTLLEILKAVIVREESRVKGRSDLIICYRGRFIACELKDDVGVPSPHQIKFIKKVREAGGSAGVCRTIYEVYMLVVEGRWTSEI